MLTGNNGILTQAQRAKNETENAQAEEQNILDSYENYLYDATGDVKQVDDSNPGVLEGSGTEEEPFVINSIEDLVVFADNVTKGTNTYQDQYVELGLSLDFNSDKSYVNPNRQDYAQYGYNGKLKEVLNTSGFIPIGLQEGTIAEIEEKSFDGDFNGNGFSIYNMNISQAKTIGENNYFMSGLFSNNMGNIKNLCIKEATSNINTEVIRYSTNALLAGRNKGMVENCLTTGNIEVTNSGMEAVGGTNIAGTIGSNEGIINECSNEANVTLSYSNCTNDRVGGVVGVNEAAGSIQNIYNIGNISCQIATNSERNEKYSYIGGTVGNNLGNINNAYCKGNINVMSDINVKTNVDGVCSRDERGTINGEIKNCYHLENIINASGTIVTITENGEVKTSDEMKSQEFLDLLNQYNSGMWKFVSGKNNGYPVLYWE